MSKTIVIANGLNVEARRNWRRVRWARLRGTIERTHGSAARLDFPNAGTIARVGAKDRLSLFDCWYKTKRFFPAL